LLWCCLIRGLFNYRKGRNHEKKETIVVFPGSIGNGRLSITTPGSAADVIKIGYTAPFTGSAAEFGTNGWRGVQIALDEINAKGVMVGGKKYTVEIVRYDSICTPTDGVANVRKLRFRTKWLLFWETTAAQFATPSHRCAQSLRYLGSQSNVPPITLPGLEMILLPNEAVGWPHGPLFTPTIVKKFDPKSTGYLVVNDDYGLGMARP